MENETVKVEWGYSEFPDIYYYFCGKCGNGIKKDTEECPHCKAKEDWTNVPK